MTEPVVEHIRRFNRFYLPVFRLLGSRYLDSRYSAGEARVLFEVYEADGCSAAHLARVMNLDKGYLSRVLRQHEKNGYLRRQVSESDSRVYELHLTDAGRALTEDFIRRSNQEIGAVIAPLDPADQARLAQALDTVMTLLQTCGRKETDHEDRTL